MATYNSPVLDFDQFSVSGSDPFSDPVNPVPGAVGSVMTLSSDARWKNLILDDDEAHFHDDETGEQPLLSDITLNGVTYPVGDQAHAGCEYVLRPAGSSDPADDFSIFAVSIEGVIVGFASAFPLADGASYTIVAEGSDGPTVLYSDLIVCFASGTMILEPRGERRVETIRAGDLVVTADDGPQPVAWAGRQSTTGRGRRAPVRLRAGVFGAARDLWLKPAAPGSRARRRSWRNAGAGQGAGGRARDKPGGAGAPGLSSPAVRTPPGDLRERHRGGKPLPRADGSAHARRWRALPGRIGAPWNPARWLIGASAAKRLLVA